MYVKSVCRTALRSCLNLNLFMVLSRALTSADFSNFPPGNRIPQIRPYGDEGPHGQGDDRSLYFRGEISAAEGAAGPENLQPDFLI